MKNTHNQKERIMLEIEINFKNLKHREFKDKRIKIPMSKGLYLYAYKKRPSLCVSSVGGDNTVQQGVYLAKGQNVSVSLPSNLVTIPNNDISVHLSYMGAEDEAGILTRAWVSRPGYVHSCDREYVFYATADAKLTIKSEARNPKSADSETQPDLEHGRISFKVQYSDLNSLDRANRHNIHNEVFGGRDE